MEIKPYYPMVLSLLIGLGALTSGVAQKTVAPPNRKAERKARPTYLDGTVGISQAVFRDRATSPHFFVGRPWYVSLAHIDEDARRRSVVELAYTSGRYVQSFNAHETASTVQVVTFNHQELYRVPLRWERFNLKLGGQLGATMNFRNNPSLFNNREGFEVITTLFAASALTWDISRRRTREGKWLFFKYQLPARQRTLSLALQVGLLNGAYRNGFVYLGQGAIRNNDDFFESYEFRLLAGFRLHSRLGYTWYLPNQNAVRLAYQWEACSTGGDQPYEMAQHTLQLSLRYKIK